MTNQKPRPKKARQNWKKTVLEIRHRGMLTHRLTIEELEKQNMISGVYEPGKVQVNI